MSTLIDGSCLLSPFPTGVSAVVSDLLRRDLLPIEADATIITIRQKEASHPLPNSRYHHLHRSFPSKLLHAYSLIGGSIQDFAPGKWTRLLLPNINIVGTPRIPYDVLVHDLSFLVHEPWFSPKTRLWHRLAYPKRLISNAERLFTLSPQTTRSIHELCHMPLDRIHQIDYCPLVPPPKVYNRPLANPYFFMLASRDPRKNAPVTTSAFIAFTKDYPDWRLVLVGGASHPPHPNILSLPYLSPEEKHRWMQYAAALLYPSWFEGFGLPMHEAAAFGVPILASSASTVTPTAPIGTTFLPPHLPHAWREAFYRFARNVGNIDKTPS